MEWFRERVPLRMRRGPFDSSNSTVRHSDRKYSLQPLAQSFRQQRNLRKIGLGKQKSVEQSFTPSMNAKLIISVRSTKRYHANVQRCRTEWSETMRDGNEFGDVLQDNSAFLLITTRSKLSCQQSWTEFLHTGDTNLLSVAKSSLTAASCEFLSKHWIVNDSDFGNLKIQLLKSSEESRNRNKYLFHKQSNGYCRMRKTVDKIHCPINGINDPCGCIGEYMSLAIAWVLLSNKLMIRVFILDSVDQHLLNLLVCLGNQINVARLFE